MTKPQIRFNETDQPFEAASDPARRNWIESSFTTDENAVGELRFEPPSNGRYGRKHPVTTPDGRVHAYIGRAFHELGYTFAALYLDGCFWVANQTFGSTSSRGDSAITLIGEKGEFLIGKDKRFGLIDAFGFDSGCVNSIKAFKRLDDGKKLLYLSSPGFALFDVHRRRIIGKAEFGELAYSFNGFDLSPKALTLAIAASYHDGKNPISGEDRYRNILRIYDLSTGDILGEHTLPTEEGHLWNVHYSNDGRQIQVRSDKLSLQYELEAI